MGLVEGCNVGNKVGCLVGSSADLESCWFVDSCGYENGWRLKTKSEIKKSKFFFFLSNGEKNLKSKYAWFPDQMIFFNKNK